MFVWNLFTYPTLHFVLSLQYKGSCDNLQCSTGSQVKSTGFRVWVWRGWRNCRQETRPAPYCLNPPTTRNNEYPQFLCLSEGSQPHLLQQIPLRPTPPLSTMHALPQLPPPRLALPNPALPCPTLPHPALPCPTLPHPTPPHTPPQPNPTPLHPQHPSSKYAGEYSQLLYLGEGSQSHRNLLQQTPPRPAPPRPTLPSPSPSGPTPPLLTPNTPPESMRVSTHSSSISVWDARATGTSFSRFRSTSL